jgi:hypothetical protein
VNLDLRRRPRKHICRDFGPDDSDATPRDINSIGSGAVEEETRAPADDAEDGTRESDDAPSSISGDADGRFHGFSAVEVE